MNEAFSGFFCEMIEMDGTILLQLLAVALELEA